MKFGNAVVKHGRAIMTAAIVLLIPSVLGMIVTRIADGMDGSSKIIFKTGAVKA